MSRIINYFPIPLSIFVVILIADFQNTCKAQVPTAQKLDKNMSLEAVDIEGIVWYSYGGKMVKIKGIDFGIKRK